MSLPQDGIPFDGPAKDDLEIAFEATGEHDSSETWVTIHRDPQPGNACAKCGEWEPCEADADEYGTRAVACLSDNLTRCANCGDHVFHTKCASKLEGTGLLCPCCAYIVKRERERAQLDEATLELTAWATLADVKRVREMLRAETDERKRESVNDLLTEIATVATDTLGESGAALIRAALGAPMIASAA